MCTCICTFCEFLVLHGDSMDYEESIPRLRNRTSVLNKRFSKFSLVTLSFRLAILLVSSMYPKGRPHRSAASKMYFLVFVCIWFNILVYCYFGSSPFISEKRSSFCEASSNNNVVIHNVCSFVHYLDIDVWSHTECYYKHPAESYGIIIGPLISLWYKLIKHQHCSTINVNALLNQQEKQQTQQFTILINTWERDKCLIKSVQHYLQCKDVAQIRIIWSDPHHDIPASLRYLQQSNNALKLVFDEYKDNKLTNRFKYNTQWVTNAIFQSDDDIMYSCDLLSNTFKLWTLFPEYMIGFAPRQPYHDDYRHKRTRNAYYQFYQWDAAYSQCEYSMLFPTVGGFMHKKYYKLYDANDINGIQNGWKQIKDSVNGNITAEDISMSLLYSFSSGYPPISVTVPETDMFIDEFLNCQGDKSLTMHTNSRQKRTNIFVDTLIVLGMDEADLISSNLWVDVMPMSDQKCWAP
eukprot:18613_1